MELKDRKKIYNLPKLLLGLVGSYWNDYTNALPYNQILTGLALPQSTALKLDVPQQLYGINLSPKPIQATPIDPAVQDGAKDNEFQGEKVENRKTSSVAGAVPWFALAEWAGSGLALGLTSTKRSNELLADAGISYGNRGGISYQRQNAVDGAAVLHEHDNDTRSRLLYDPFGALGRWLTRGKQKREIAKALTRATNLNELNQASAFTDALQQDYNLNHIDTRNSFLHAEHGKDAVESAGGETNMKQNAWVNKGEYIWDGGANLNYIDHGPNDTAKAFVKDSDTVFTTNYGIADMVPYAAMTGQLPMLAEYLRMLHNNPKYKNGKCAMPKMKLGWDNIATSTMGALASIGQIIDASRQDIKVPNIYAPNRYGNRALTTLAGIHSNPYPVLQQMRSAYDQGRYDINRAGGLSGSQNYLANVALAVLNQRNIANSLAQLQQQDNAYRTTYGQVAGQLGAQEANNLQAANQYREQYAAASHAAKQQGKQMGLRNLMDYVNQFYKNRNKLNEFNRMYNLYAQENAIKEQDMRNRAKYYGIV